MDRIRSKRPRIAVVGDLMIDHYVWGACERISPEAPVPVVSMERETRVLGGAGNVVNNLHALGAEVAIFSVVGEDRRAETMRLLLEEIPTHHVALIGEGGRKTTQKSRIIASNQQVIRYDDETTQPITLHSQYQLLEALKRELMWWCYQTMLRGY